MTITQKARTRGFKVGLNKMGITVRTDTNEVAVVFRRDIASLTDPQQSAKGELPIYCELKGLTGEACAALGIRVEIANPRSVGQFIEVKEDGTDGRAYQVLQVLPTTDPVSWTWQCEATRE